MKKNYLSEIQSPAIPLSYDETLGRLISEGWEMQSEGTSGAQLKFPKKMRTQTKVALVAGAVLVFAYGLGLILILFAMIDYAMLKTPTHFLSRATPTLPQASRQEASILGVCFLLLIVLLIVLLIALVAARAGMY